MLGDKAPHASKPQCSTRTASEVPAGRERDYNEWSSRFDQTGEELGTAEEAQVRAWLLHLVKLKGDECAAYLRSPELTALVRRGIASELIPPAKCLVDYV